MKEKVVPPQTKMVFPILGKQLYQGVRAVLMFNYSPIHLPSSCIHLNSALTAQRCERIGYCLGSKGQNL